MFIEGKKYKALVEAMKNGDDKAKTILLAQYNNEGDSVEQMLEEYFKEPEMVENEPEVEEIEEVVEPEEHKEGQKLSYAEKLQKFLKDNGIKDDDPEYNEVVEEFGKEYPDEEKEDQKEEECSCSPLDEMIQFLIDDEQEAIRGYNDVALKISTMELNDSERKGLMAVLEEIKNEEYDHIEKLRRLLEKHSGIEN